MIHNANDKDKDKFHLLARQLGHRSPRPITLSYTMSYCEQQQLTVLFKELLEQFQTEEEPHTQEEEPNKEQSEAPEDET